MSGPVPRADGPVALGGQIRALAAAQLGMEPLLPQTQSPSTPPDQRDRAISQERRAEALKLRVAGVAIDQIAERLQVSTTRVEQIVSEELAKQGHGTRDLNRAREALRAAENARLDRAQAAIWTQVNDGSLPAVDRLLRIMERRARLNGLDAPTTVAVSAHVAVEMEGALSALESILLASSASTEPHRGTYVPQTPLTIIDAEIEDADDEPLADIAADHPD